MRKARLKAEFGTDKPIQTESTLPPRMLTFLWSDSTPIRGPLTFTRLRELWDAREINGESKLFMTDRDDETNKVRCVNIKAEQIRHNLETGVEIDLESLRPPEGW